MSRRAGPAGFEQRGQERVTAIMRVEDIARVVHEANSGLQAIADEPVNPRWDEAPEWQRWSCIEGVRDALIVLNGGFMPNATPHPQQHHEMWLATMRDEGWTYGPVKDGDAKTHPYLVEWEELPPEQQAKTRLFLAIVAALRES